MVAEATWGWADRFGPPILEARDRPNRLAIHRDPTVGLVYHCEQPGGGGGGSLSEPVHEEPLRHCRALLGILPPPAAAVEVEVEGAPAGIRAQCNEGVWLALVPYGAPATVRFRDGAGREVARERRCAMTFRAARDQVMPTLGMTLRRPRGHPRAFLRVERGPGVLSVCPGPRHGALVLLEQYPDAHGSVFAYPDDGWATSLNPGEGWRTTFGFPPAGAHHAEAQTESGAPLSVFLAPGRAWLAFVPEDEASDLCFTDDMDAAIQRLRLFDPAAQSQCRIDFEPEPVDLEALGGLGGLGYGEPLWSREFAEHVVGVCDGDEGLAIVCALRSGACSADAMDERGLVHELRLPDALILYGARPEAAFSGEARLADGRSESVLLFPGTWLVALPLSESPIVLLRDSGGAIVRTIDVERAPRSFSTAPIDDGDGTSHSFGVVDDPRDPLI